MPILLGNSGSPRWYTGSGHTFDAYLDRLVTWGATSAEVVLHHGPFDERTARVHVVEADWPTTIRGYQEHGIALQLHVSLDPRFATARWREDRDSLKAEYQPLLALAAEIAQEQGRLILVLHGADDPAASSIENADATVGLLDWLAITIEAYSLPVTPAVEIGASKPGKETAVARSRESVFGLVERVGASSLGICWDLAHDYENRTRETGWSVVPDVRFLRRVVHVHLHDLDDEGVTHYPLVLGNLPYAVQLEALARVGPLPSLTMEIRWRCAQRLGEPWAMLAESYRVVEQALARIEADQD